MLIKSLKNINLLTKDIMVTKLCDKRRSKYISTLTMPNQFRTSFSHHSKKIKTEFKKKLHAFKNDAKGIKRDEYGSEFDLKFCTFLKFKEGQELFRKSKNYEVNLLKIMICDSGDVILNAVHWKWCDFIFFSCLHNRAAFFSGFSSEASFWNFWLRSFIYVLQHFSFKEVTN